MSIRATPARQGSSGRTAQSPLSPTLSSGSSAEANTFRRPRLKGNFGFSSLSSVGESSRRPSGTTSRKVSGLSQAESINTVNGRSRQKGTNGDKADIGDNDWASMDADEVFRRLPVNQVRRVEAKMREDAMNKQSELRSMVGTRYRDLLTSATQITSLRESSLHLSKSFKSISSSCASPEDAVPVTGSDTGESTEAEEVMNLLPAAAHMKLLLDAPEALYAHLAHHEYLKAAFLWLVARVAKEGLSTMNTDTTTAYYPLLQKQWETLLPFRAQITQRAIASLRDRGKPDVKTLSETILAIILLDNLPVSEAVSLFLGQRTKTLRDILSASGPKKGASDDDHQKDVEKILVEGVTSVLETVTLAKAIFVAPPGGSEKESLLEQKIRLLQIGEPLPPPKPIQTGPRSRRASRLASISAPLPKLSLLDGGPPISAARVLQDLPSDQILLRHLPTSITCFTPFITPSQSPIQPKTLEEWSDQAAASLTGSVPELLRPISSINEVWRIRHTIHSLLVKEDIGMRMQESLETQWEERVKAIWTEKLDTLLTLSEDRIRFATSEVMEKADCHDTFPDEHIFSEMSFPSVMSVHTASAAPFDHFLGAIRKRRSGRTPLLDTVLSQLEGSAVGIKIDLQVLPMKMLETYGEQVQTILEQMIGTMRYILDDLRAGGSVKNGVEAELLVGRIALFISKSSTLLEDINGGTRIDLSDVSNQLMVIHASSVKSWHDRAVKTAVKMLEPIFDPKIGPKQVRAIWQGDHPIQPSNSIMVALQSLVTATTQLGIPPNLDTTVASDLLRDFVQTARSLEAWNTLVDEGHAQAAFDIGFMGLVVGDKVKSDKGVQQHLAKMPSDTGAFKDALPTLLLDYLRRTQTLIAPLITHLDSKILAPGVKAGETRNGLLRFGAPKSAAGGAMTEYRSPIAVAKPGPRFPLLSMAA